MNNESLHAFSSVCVISAEGSRAEEMLIRNPLIILEQDSLLSEKMEKASRRPIN